jgi:hypothetical protein
MRSLPEKSRGEGTKYGCSRRLLGLVEKRSQGGSIDQLDRFLPNPDESFRLEARQYPTHGLELQSEVTPDFSTRHAAQTAR